MEECGTGAHRRAWLLYRLARLRRYTDPRGGIARLNEAARLATEVGDHALAASALFGRGLLRCWTEEISPGLADMEAGIAALDTCTALPDEDAPRGTLTAWLAHVGRHQEACHLGERVLAEGRAPVVAEGLGGSSYADACCGLAIVHANMGRPNEALPLLARAREVYRAIDHHLLFVMSTVQELTCVLQYATDDLAARQRLATEAEEALVRASGVQAGLPPRLARLALLPLEGYWDEAHQLALIGHAAGGNSTPFAVAVLGPLAREQGDVGLAWRLVREGLPEGPTGAPGGTFFAMAQVLQRLATGLAIDAGDLATARAWLAAHDRWLTWSGATLGWAESHLLRVTYARAAGDVALAHRHATQALARAARPRQPLILLAAHRLLGHLDTAAGRVTAAATHLSAALALAEACAAPYERALTLLALAELRGFGDGDRVQALLDEARTICTPLGAKPALARAEALSDRLAAGEGTPTTASRPASTRYRQPAANPARLTAREVEVLRLIATGQTDREIAAALSLSTRTVSNYVVHILTKTATENRTAAAAFALRHGLA